MFGKLPSYSIPDGQEGLRGSNLEKAGCCFFQMGLFDFCRPEQSYRESAPSGAVPATAGALSAAVPLFYISEKAMMKEGTRFRRKICGLLPWTLLLSLEDVRQLAGRYSSFVGRCPAACRGVILLSWAVSLSPSACRRAILLSSPKEESRKAPPFRMGGRRLGGLTPKTPATDKRQAIPLPAAPGLTLQAG